MSKLKNICKLFDLSFGKNVGWGNKKSGLSARKFCSNNKHKLSIIEDGFVSYIKKCNFPLSIVIDDEGIYYDASRPSAITRHILQPLSKEQKFRASKLISSIKRHNISKYNDGYEYDNRTWVNIF